MTNYKICKNAFNQIVSIHRQDDWYLPLDPANTDYANFKKEVLEGAELQDADGVVMSADAAKEFVRNLP